MERKFTHWVIDIIVLRHVPINNCNVIFVRQKRSLLFIILNTRRTALKLIEAYRKYC